MGNLFGVRRRAPQVTPQDRTILQLKQQRDRIKMYQKRTEAELVKNKELSVKLYNNGMQDRAIIVLRRKKMMEDILIRTDKQLETLEQLVADIEYTQIEMSVVEGLRVGTEALKQLNSLMNIDDIQQMMDDNAEAAEKQREITAILQQSCERYDEQDLLKELEKYQEQAVAVEKVSQPAQEDRDLEPDEKAAVEIEDLPNVPDTPIKTADQPEAEAEGERVAVEAEEKRAKDDEQENVRPKEGRKILVESS